MSEKDKELLAAFHHTISEQLNSRLSESPQFFGLLVVVATGYGYALARPELHLKTLATALAMAATLWAGWYLAALGYPEGACSAVAEIVAVRSSRNCTE